MRRPRRKPYTARGISRIPCQRCGAPSSYQWQICSDGNQYRGVCKRCDIGLNRLVVRFMRLPRSCIRRYEAALTAAVLVVILVAGCATPTATVSYSLCYAPTVDAEACAYFEPGVEEDE